MIVETNTNICHRHGCVVELDSLCVMCEAQNEGTLSSAYVFTESGIGSLFYGYTITKSGSYIGVGNRAVYREDKDDRGYKTWEKVWQHMIRSVAVTDPDKTFAKSNIRSTLFR